MDDCTCLVDYDYSDNLAEICTTTIRTARKSHQCCECGEAITPGDRYEHVRGKWEGTFSTNSTCEGCLNIRTALCCTTWCYGKLFEDLHDSDLLTPDRPIMACVLDELSTAGAQKIKQQWWAAVEARQ